MRYLKTIIDVGSSNNTYNIDAYTHMHALQHTFTGCDYHTINWLSIGTASRSPNLSSGCHIRLATTTRSSHIDAEEIEFHQLWFEVYDGSQFFTFFTIVIAAIHCLLQH